MQDRDREDIRAECERRNAVPRVDDRVLVWRAQLADMPIAIVLAFLRERGAGLFCGCEYCQAVWDAELARDVEHVGEAGFMARLSGRDTLPAVYPRMADEEG
jgi:hypothetical protein